MAEETAKLKVAVELKNGDYHSMGCSSIDIDKDRIELYGAYDLTNIKLEDISLLSISIVEHSSL